MIKAAVFDFDGLILDTETPEFQSFVQVFQEHGAELTMEGWGRCIGAAPGSFNPYAHLEQCPGFAIDKTAVRARRRAIYEQLMQGADARPGVARLDGGAAAGQGARRAEPGIGGAAQRGAR
ncbi:HAD hydrolase-like protein [Paenibacillus ginsengihumi]|uniref:HAD hydrolase-like protein n=1 Tax=Paenibacillus ginsengihumi TaxID=431596 RepID=UPI000380B365|nr:HAD hydrolase-like protein [Paenibacillus ginsengihumi]